MQPVSMDLNNCFYVLVDFVCLTFCIILYVLYYSHVILFTCMEQFYKEGRSVVQVWYSLCNRARDSI